MDSRFGDKASLIRFYEYQLHRFLLLGVGSSTYQEGYNHDGVIVNENLINATRRRLAQLKSENLKKKSNLK